MIEAFSERFYEQQSSEIFASKDTVHILCYSLIMLNTDQHNPQVKKKMTEDEFIRNNRAINAGKDLPREYLSELFQSISTNAFALSTHSDPVEMNPNRWIELMNRKKTTQPFSLCQFDRRIGRDMFATIAGPSIAVTSLEKSFIMAHEDLGFTPSGCIYCIDHFVFPTIDDLHEKLLDYSRRENAEREMRSMEWTLKIAMKMLKNVFLHYLEQIVGSAEFRTFWLGVLSRMDTCMKADLGEYGDNKFQEVVPELLTIMIGTMKEKEILVQKEDDDLWEITYIQIQWIAPSLKDELFPDEEI